MLFPLAEAHNALLDSFLLDANAGAVVGAIALERLLADTGAVEYAYRLTSPPRSEGVHWRLRVARKGVNALQLLAFEFTIGGERNSRPRQPLAGRTVVVRRWGRAVSE